MASLWPARFGDGWVTVDQFRQYGFHLRHRHDRESLKTTIRNAIASFRRLMVPLTIDSERVDIWSEEEQKDLREDHRRLVGVIPLRLWIWLMGDGVRHLEPGLRQEFHDSQFQLATSVDEILPELEDTIIRVHLARGAYDLALTRARAALGRTTAPRSRRPLRLTLATVLLRRGTVSDLAEAETELTSLQAEDIPILDHADLLAEARTRISLGYCRFFRHVRGTEPATRALHDRVRQIRLLLFDADALAAELSLSDRAQVANLRGLLFKWDAQVATVDDEQEELYELAERHLRQALELWRLGHDPYGAGVSLYNLGELAFSRYRLHRGEGTLDQIEEALKWYEASVELTTQVPALREWFLDYARAAECTIRLFPHLVRAGRAHECVTRWDVLQRRLALGRISVPSESVQGRMFSRIERLLEQVWDECSPPLPPLSEIRNARGKKKPQDD